MALKNRRKNPAITVAAPGTPSGDVTAKAKPRRRRRDEGFTPALGALICNKVASGLSRTAVAGAVGITPVQLAAWLKASGEGTLERDELGFYEDFVVAESQGQAEHERRLIKMATSRRVSGSNVRAQEIFLSRRYRADWNPRQQVEHTGKDGGPIHAAVLHGTVMDFLGPARELELEERQERYDRLKKKTEVLAEGESVTFGRDDPLSVLKAELGSDEAADESV